MKTPPVRIPILVFAVAAACVAWGGEQGKKVSVSLADRPLAELFARLKKEGGVNIVYSRERLCTGGREVTISIDVKDMKAEDVLMLASRAAGFSFVREGGVYVVFPLDDAPGRREPPPAGRGPGGGQEKRSPSNGNVSRAASHPAAGKRAGERRTVAVFPGRKASLPGGGRYRGNFVYGQGDKVYLDLVIPELDAREMNRIRKAMAEAVRDHRLTTEEAARLFGEGSRLRGREIGLFVDALYPRVVSALEDGKLTDTEIHRLRNGFINAVRNAYEGM